MKNSKIILTILITYFSTIFSVSAFTHNPTEELSYAYIVVKGKFLSKKLWVNIDLGEKPEQLREAKSYTEALANTTSIASVLNYMVEQEFELVQTLDYTDMSDGNGGTSGIVFIMRKVPQKND